MARYVLLGLLVGLALVAESSSSGLFETLLSWELPNSEARSSTPQSKCLCQTSGCLCCVDLNLTSSIDLGGPACVNIKQREENVSLNLNYGDNPVHNATIKIVDAANKPTCMNLLSDLAQICAKFVSIKAAESGHDGCLVIEPALLGTPQATYHMGCFHFNQGVRQIEVAAITETTEPTDSSEEEDEEINTDELIAAVSASAEQGIALFSQWLGLNLGPRLNVTSPQNRQVEEEEAEEGEFDDEEEEEEKIEIVTPKATNENLTNVHVPVSSRTARKLSDEKKEDIRFKQLLSAQDNIVRESAKIPTDGARTTFVYSKPVDQNKFTGSKKENELQSKPQLTVVPRESRRGGRAYNIHQHVNEI